MKKSEEKFEEWERYAEYDSQTAEILIREQGPSNPICFHAQQVAEKYLKGFLVVQKIEFKKTHQLEYLLTLCEQSDNSFEKLRDDIAYLSEFYTEVRYPADMPEFSLDECQKAFEAAKNVRDFVKEKVKNA